MDEADRLARLAEEQMNFARVVMAAALALEEGEFEEQEAKDMIKSWNDDSAGFEPYPGDVWFDRAQNELEAMY
jgi:hypothetical protein